MNQILVSDKIYVTPDVIKKQKKYKRIFTISLILVVFFFSYYVYSESERNKSEAISQDILEQINFGFGDTTIQEDTLVISLNEGNPDEVASENFEDIVINPSANTYTTDAGVTYTVDSILTIQSLGIKYPVLTETSDELLKISLNKFWGNGANKIGNYCIVGHNYKSGKMFGKLSKMQVGDTIELQDSSGKTITYSVYNKFIFDPTDVTCTSQLTNGKKEVTLITCINSGTQRLVVKCREVK